MRFILAALLALAAAPALATPPAPACPDRIAGPAEVEACAAAFEAGQEGAARPLFDAYWYGRGVAQDRARADAVAERAAQKGLAWARVVRAARLEPLDPAAGRARWEGLARDGHCAGQLRLAQILDKEKERPQAYFWAVAAAGQPRSATHPLFDETLVGGACGSEAFLLKSDLARHLPETARTQAEAAAAAWRPGQEPPELAALRPDPPAGPAPAPQQAVPVLRPMPPSPSAPMPAWQPLPASDRLQPGKGRKDAEEVYAAASPSVWMVLAAADEAAVKARRNMTQGSAVAVTDRLLLTNCHVVEGRAWVEIRHRGQRHAAMLAAADRATDRCLLKAPVKLTPAPGLRPVSSVRPGETVYTLGAPAGLELTLAQGLVSGLREVKGIRHVQMTAPISPGSSGGGLFDGAGNLLGITTFLLRDHQGLNFAIAAEEYFR